MAETRIYAKDKKRLQTVKATNAGRRMLEKTRATATKLIYARSVEMFSEYLGKGLDEIVEEYKSDAEANMYKAFEKWEEILEDFGRWLEKKKTLKGASVKTYFVGAKQLINANVPRSLRIQVKAPKRRSRSIPPITIEDLRKIRKVTDERESAFIDLLKDSGISRDDAIDMTYEQIKKAVEDPTVQYHPIRMFRRKEQVEYATWIGSNAIESLRLYFEIRKRRGETITDETPIFASEHKPHNRISPMALTVMLERLSQKTGIKISTHRLRKFFETYVATAGIHPAVAKYWMGHSLGSDIESRYIIPPEEGEHGQREQYMKAYPYIDLRETRESEDLLMAEIKARLTTMNPNTRRTYVNELKAIFGEKRLERLAVTDTELKELLQAQVTDGGVAYGSAQFEQISEKELLVYMRNGWQIVHRLSSGEVIVKR